MSHVARIVAFAVAIVVICGAVGIMPSCAGRHAREQVLVPTLRPSVDPIARWARAYAATLPANEAETAESVIGSWSAAVASGDIDRVAEDGAALWPLVRSYAVGGVSVMEDAGQVGPLSADSFRENIAAFAEALAVSVERARR